MWKNDKINVLIPMAGQGSRFVQAGYTTIKPLIDVNGKFMVELVIDSLNIDANFIFVICGEHCEEYDLENILPRLRPNCTIIKTWGKQQGTTHSVLAAKNVINNNNPLLISNADQIWNWDSEKFYTQISTEDISGSIVTFIDNTKNPKYSFAKVDENGFVIEVAEKNPISNLGTAGIYYYKFGCEFVKYAEQMIAKNIRVNNEFYVVPVYNEFIQDNKKIKAFNCNKLIELGTPEALESYLNATRTQET
jgi:dTDP-glucose pyrophosphorylase